MKDDKRIARGAHYYRIIYPGHLQLLSGVSYQVPFNNSLSLVQVKRHITSCVVLAHGNHFVKTKNLNGEFSFLKRPIEHQPENVISADFSAVQSRRLESFVFTKESLYTTYSMKPFTELLVGIERYSNDLNEKADYKEFSKVFELFIDLYRAMTGDIRIRSLSSLDHDWPIIFWNFIAYKDQSSKTTPVQRLNTSWPESFQPWHVPLEEFARRVASDAKEIEFRSGKFADYLVSGASPSEPQKALMDCLETLDKTRRFKYAVVESFSIAEIVWNQLFKKLGPHSPRIEALIKGKTRNHGGVPAKAALNSILPQIVGIDSADDREFIRAMNLVRSKRDAIVHKGEDCDGEFAAFAIQAVQKLINRAQLALWKYGEEIT